MMQTRIHPYSSLAVEPLQNREVAVPSLTRHAAPKPGSNDLCGGVNKFYRAAVIWLLALFTCISSMAYAVPNTVNYQGQLSTVSGVAVDATVSMTFSLYDVASGGTALWSETQSVAVSNGQYSVTLGQVTPLPPSVLVSATHFGIKVETDNEMTPRIALSSAPYAMLSSCTSGDQMDCYSGASATRNVGACLSGKRNCTSQIWDSACDGEVLPDTEVLNGIDDDCDGVIDNGAGCWIGGAGYANGATNPANSCQVCNMLASTVAWSNTASGTACNDESSCTINDVCDGAGSCSGTMNVDDGVFCTVDSCDGVNVTHTTENALCGDGEVCTGGGCQAI